MGWKKDTRAALCCWWRWDSEGPFKYGIAKWIYLLGWIVTLIVTWVLRDYASESLLDSVGPIQDFCKTASTPEAKKSCAAGQIAMRMSFGNFIFFIAHAIIMFQLRYQDDPRVDVQCSGWLLKIVVWVGLLVGLFYVPANTINGYAQFARVGSGIFLLLQLILMVDFIHDITEWLVEQDTAATRVVLAVGSGLTISLSVVGTAIAYWWYTASPTCGLFIFFCTWSLIAGFIMIGVLFIPNAAENAVLLTSGLVWLYTSFLLLSAFSSSPKDQYEQCHRGEGSNPRWVQIVSFFIALAVVIYSTLSAAGDSREMFGRPGDSFNEDTHVPYRPDFFHAIFALGSLYIAMLFSNWEVSGSNKEFQIDVGVVSMWVKMGSKWACELLYIWTVIAPALFRDRDFSGRV